MCATAQYTSKVWMAIVWLFFQPKLLLRHHFWGRTKAGREVRILGSHAVSIWGVMLCDRLFKDMIWAPPPRPVLSFEQIKPGSWNIKKYCLCINNGNLRNGIWLPNLQWFWMMMHHTTAAPMSHLLVKTQHLLLRDRGKRALQNQCCPIDDINFSKSGSLCNYWTRTRLRCRQRQLGL